MHKRLDNGELYFNQHISYISQDHCIKLDSRIATSIDKETSIFRESTNVLSRITGEYAKL